MCELRVQFLSAYLSNALTLSSQVLPAESTQPTMALPPGAGQSESPSLTTLPSPAASALAPVPTEPDLTGKRCHAKAASLPTPHTFFLQEQKHQTFFSSSLLA